MDTSDKANQDLGTAAQAAFIEQLAGALGFADVAAALTSLGMAAPLTVKEASQAIDRLKAKLPAQEEHGRRKFLTARHLLLIDRGEMSAPDDLDTDAATVLQRLAKLREVERVLQMPAQWGGANRGGPILVEHLVQHFGSLESVAAAFGVSLSTVKGWGAVLPEQKSYEAEVKTRGWVCAARS